MAAATCNLPEFNLLSVEESVKNGNLKVYPSHILKKKHKNASNVWTVFQDIHTVQDDKLLQNFVWCPRCQKPLMYDCSGGTNKLRNHLKKCSEATGNEIGKSTFL